MPLALILAVGQDSELLDTRSYILRSAGYEVDSVMSTDQAIQRFKNGDFDLVLLCHSIPVEEREWIRATVHASSPRTPVVSIASVFWVFSEHPDLAADMTINGAPEKLLRGISDVLAEASAAYGLRKSNHGKKMPPSLSEAQDNAKRDEA